jgi:hypothetical protein
MIGFDTFHGKDGKTYLAFKQRPRGGYPVFTEVEAKEAACKSGRSGDIRRFACANGGFGISHR